MGSLRSSNTGDTPRWPAHWWEPVSPEGAPAWEILPQEASPPEVILSKRNELGLLSNFSITPFHLDGIRYWSVEGFWQMMLFPESEDDERAILARKRGLDWKYRREDVAKMWGFEAKRAGEYAESLMRKLDIDWCTYLGVRARYRSKEPGLHYQWILSAMRAKLDENPAVSGVLKSTRGLALRPDHRPEPDAPPEWWYFRIWEQLRDERFQAPAHASPNRE
jgi:hypothetical protein